MLSLSNVDKECDGEILDARESVIEVWIDNGEVLFANGVANGESSGTSFLDCRFSTRK